MRRPHILSQRGRGWTRSSHPSSFLCHRSVSPAWRGRRHGNRATASSRHAHGCNRRVPLRHSLLGLQGYSRLSDRPRRPVVGILAMNAMACPPAGEVARYELPSSMALNVPKARRSRHDAGRLFHGLALCDVPKHASIPFAAGTGSRAKGGSSLLVRRARADGVFVMATVSPSRSRIGCGGISTTSRVERRRAQSWFRFLGADRACRYGARAQARIRLFSDPLDLRRRIE